MITEVHSGKIVFGDYRLKKILVHMCVIFGCIYACVITIIVGTLCILVMNKTIQFPVVLLQSFLFPEVKHGSL